MRIQERKDECVIELKWLYALEEQPPLLVDMCLAVQVELGRRGTRFPIKPKRIDLKQRRERGNAHEAYFNCPIKFRASRNAIVLHRQDLERPAAETHWAVTFQQQLLCRREPKGAERNCPPV